MKYLRLELSDIECVGNPVIHDGRLWYIVQEERPEYPRGCHDFRTSDLFLIAPLDRYGDYSDADASVENILALLEDIDDSITDTISYDDIKDPASHQKLMDIAEQYGFFVVPVYACIHSGIKFSLSPVGDKRDSGQCGWMYAAPAAVKEAGGLDTMKQIAEEEITILNMYLCGNVYDICSSRIEYIADGYVYTDPYIEWELCEIYGLDNAQRELKELTDEQQG